jgi:hypothetical protein
MSNTVIQIRRSTTATAPSSLQNGELAFTSNGDTLWIGSPAGSNTANVIHIGAKISYVGNSTHLGATTTGSNNELASTYAIKNFVANQISSFTTTLSGLTDVDTAGAANNDILVYDAASGKWETKNISGTSNQVDVTFSNNNIVVGLSDDVDITANVTIGGAANVTGEAHFFDVVHVNIDHPAHVVHYITNPTVIATVDTDSYGQVAMQNFNGGANASSDFIAYPNNTAVDDNTGFIDMGITGNGYNQAAYSITSPNDGYLFASARAGDNLGGSLVLATDSTGTNNDIKFFAGGFTFNANQAHMVLAANTRSFGINNAAPVAKLSVGGDAWINGNTETQSILPLANTTYNLGSAAATWLNVYANTVIAANVSATDIYGTVQTASQPNITTVGTLTDLSVAGNTVLGDASSDVVSFVASVNTAIIPSANITYDLGSSTKRWNTVYANTGNFVDVTVSGDLTVSGTLTTVDTQNLVVEDSLIRLARNQANTGTFTDAVDIGFYGVYGNTSSTFYAGLARESGTDNFVLFSNNSVSPDNDGVEVGDSLATLYAFLNTGAFVANATNIAITANSTVNVAIVANTLTLSSALEVASGGTGLASLSNNYIMVGNTTGPVTMVGSSTEGHVLQISSSGAPTFGSLDGGSF